MPWTANIVSKVKDSFGKINLVVNFDNVATNEHHLGQTVSGLANIGDVNRYIKAQLDFYQNSDDTLAVINTGVYTPTTLPDPTPAEIALAQTKQDFYSARQILRNAKELVDLSVLNPTQAGLTAKQAAIKAITDANPSFIGI